VSSLGKRDAPSGTALTERRRQNIMPTKPMTARRRAPAAVPRPMTAPLRGFLSNGTLVVASAVVAELPETFMAARELPAGLLELLVHEELENAA
jgi:hypothetical protein